jgi:Kef-type K+ transport system membrane component KefB
MLGAWLFQRLRIPQVIGYIAIGLLLGDSGFGVIALPDLVIWVWACSRRAVSPSASR